MMTSAINTLTEPNNLSIQALHNPYKPARPIPGKSFRNRNYRLARAQCLLGQSNIQIHVAAADQIPEVLLEIGRLREMTFRLIGEGTGVTHVTSINTITTTNILSHGMMSLRR